MILEIALGIVLGGIFLYFLPVVLVAILAVLVWPIVALFEWLES